MSSANPTVRLGKTTRELARPILRAYVFAYLSTSTPSLISLSVAVLRGKTIARHALKKALVIIRESAGADRFPACAAFVIAGSTIGPRFLLSLWTSITESPERRGLSAKKIYREPITKFIAAFLSALAVFQLLNRRPSKPLPNPRTYADMIQTFSATGKVDQERPRRRSSVTFGSVGPVDATAIPQLAGRTMDMTTFGIVHASVVIASVGLQTYRDTRLPSTSSSASTLGVGNIAAPFSFIVSCSVIMWAWFYFPDRLPSSYQNWITSAAQLDPRLREALRQCRFGNFAYGKETGIGNLVGSMARELHYPEEWGNPAKVIPVPCELYHSGSGANCEWHAISRFVQAWKFALRMYLPLNLLILLRKSPSRRNATRAVLEAAQSSAFLGAFVSLFYYGVCLARTRIGPSVIGTDTVSRQMIDGGICVGTGCLTCGWSILLEKAARRPEMALFVAPRALATILPLRYDRQYIGRERMAFALSAAIVLTAAQTKPQNVKGVFGRLLHQVLN